MYTLLLQYIQLNNLFSFFTSWKMGYVADLVVQGIQGYTVLKTLPFLMWLVNVWIIFNIWKLFIVLLLVLYSKVHEITVLCRSKCKWWTLLMKLNTNICDQNILFFFKTSALLSSLLMNIKVFYCCSEHCSLMITLAYKIFFFSVMSTKVVELNSIFYAECKYVLSFSLSRKLFKWHTVIIWRKLTFTCYISVLLHYLKNSCGWFSAVCHLWNISLEGPAVVI
jgi:hypothetical protein